MSVDILAVHGIGNHQKRTPDEAAVQLAQQWAKSLALPPSRSDSIAAAYYADQLHLRAHGDDDDLDALDAAFDGLPYELLEVWMRELGWLETQPQGFHRPSLRQLASWFVLRYNLDRATVDSFVGAFLREVTVYFHPSDPRPRQATRSIIGTAISTHRPRIILAHSLGSVATYETLWEYPHLEVELLVTLGSPLALPGRIFPRLQPVPSNGRGARPPGVQRWVNVADIGDPVAIPGTSAGTSTESSPIARLLKGCSSHIAAGATLDRKYCAKSSRTT